MKKIQEIVTKAHQRNQFVRFWSTPDREDFWSELLKNDVDVFNCDDYKRLSQFLLSEP